MENFSRLDYSLQDGKIVGKCIVCDVDLVTINMKPGIFEVRCPNCTERELVTIDNDEIKPYK